jgi:catechol 2,3-dioxygenase-like lactoylglutathione lyase family enzyme
MTLARFSVNSPWKRAIRAETPDGIPFDSPYREVAQIGLKIAFVLDPAGTRIELAEGR